MNEPSPTSIPVAASVASLLIILAVGGVCIFFWAKTHSIAFLVGAIGCLVLAPLWYRSPLSFTTPIGSRATYKRKFTRLDMVLTACGYPLLIVAVCLWILG
jgi:hypothetical protein